MSIASRRRSKAASRAHSSAPGSRRPRAAVARSAAHDHPASTGIPVAQSRRAAWFAIFNLMAGSAPRRSAVVAGAALQARLLAYLESLRTRRYDGGALAQVPVLLRHYVERSVWAGRTMEFEPGDTLNHHVVSQDVAASRERTVNRHRNLDLLTRMYVSWQRRAAQVFPKNFTSFVVHLQPARDLSAKASPGRFPRDSPCIRDLKAVGKTLSHVDDPGGLQERNPGPEASNQPVSRKKRIRGRLIAFVQNESGMLACGVPQCLFPHLRECRPVPCVRRVVKHVGS